MNQVHTCPDCSTRTSMNFLFEKDSSAYMMLDKEMIGLADLPARLYCPACPWSMTGVLRDCVIDMETWRLKAGSFIQNR